MTTSRRVSVDALSTKEYTLTTIEPTQNAADTTVDVDIQTIALAIAEAAAEMKALGIRIIDVRGIVSYTDYIVVCHGTSVTHARAISDFIREDLRPLKLRPRHTEGADYAEWILLDFFDVVVHVFTEEARQEYSIDGLFSDAPRIPFEDENGDMSDGSGLA